MLSELTIRDVLLIEALTLNFDQGLSVLTGETGAGKSILLDSLGFALGWRGRSDMVRPGASLGEVIAIFDLTGDHPAQTVLAEAGMPQEDTLVLRRVATPEGRKRAYVNDRRCSGDLLRALSDCLVELHGQQDDRGLLDAAAHRGLLDDFAAVDDLLVNTRTAWNAWRDARTALAEAQEALAAAERDRAFLTHAVAELQEFGPEPGEDETLDIRRRQMQLAERVREDVGNALGAMGRDGAEGRLSDALRWLELVAGRSEGALDAPLAALSRALSELGEAERDVTAFLRELEGDPAELEMIEERLFALRALARKHAVQPDELAKLTADLATRLSRIEAGEAGLADLQAVAERAEAAYADAATALSAARRTAAGRLDAAMAEELAPLKMERAIFRTAVAPEPGSAGPEGWDRVGFEVATNPGAKPGPISRIASGGELSRFLLALKVCLAGRAPSGGNVTMIFDEIDRGVGGATADAVGRRLAALAEGAQVLVVTHSPQVAALGRHHWRVTKRVEDTKTYSDVEALSPAARRDEIARMLSGDVVTDAARAAATALLEG